MNTILILGVILFVLMESIGGKRGVKSFWTLLLNFLILFLTILLISYGQNPIMVTLIACIAISCITLFFINKKNDKTIAALISVLITLALLMVMIYFIGRTAKIQGFGEEEYDEISSFNLYLSLDFVKIVTCTMITGLIGAVIDTSISISSVINEIYENNPSLTLQRLFRAGMEIGRDILGTMTNTLYFAFVGGYLALLLWFKDLNYSLGEMINSKVFAAEMLQIFISGMGVTFIIPVTAFITAYLLTQNKTDKSA